MISKKVNLHLLQNQGAELTPTYGARALNTRVPRYELPEQEMLPRIAYSLIHDELMLDGNARPPFHGRGFFPSLGSEYSLHNPLVIMTAFEAVVGLLIEISFIATFTQRFFGR